MLASFDAISEVNMVSQIVKLPFPKFFQCLKYSVSQLRSNLS